MQVQRLKSLGTEELSSWKVITGPFSYDDGGGDHDGDHDGDGDGDHGDHAHNADGGGGGDDDDYGE